MIETPEYIKVLTINDINIELEKGIEEIYGQKR